ncbi:MAG: hypothetical protein MRY59_03300 [Aquisalinus sp.]|nr:hypothetical protein [Aquisalinus sp.]
MAILEVIAASGATALIISMIVFALNADSAKTGNWIIPAVLSIVFFLYSAITVSQEGLTGFWTEHISDMWGTQIWLDLLLAIGIGFFLLAPQARAVGMKLFPWLVFILCTGCIGLLAMLARFLYLKDRAESAP